MSNIERRAGFTLIEMMAVMLIIALLSGLAVTMTAGSGRARLKATALDAVALLRRERLGAMLSGRPQHVALDREKRELIGESGGKVVLPRDVELAILSAEGAPGQMQPIVRFLPDGASSGAVLTFARERAEYEVRVNWFTGGVSIDAH
jgi:general secretion pathway protein H